MQWNKHGVIGFLALMGFIGAAYIKNWQIDWVYFGVAIVSYSISVIFHSSFFPSEVKISDPGWTIPVFGLYLFLLGSHLSLILLSVGFFITSSGGIQTATIFIVCLLIGLTIPRLILKLHLKTLTVNLDGLLGVVALTVIIIAYFFHQSTPGAYFVASIVVYTIPYVIFILIMTDYNNYDRREAETESLTDRARLIIWGWHLALFFLSAGMFIDTQLSPLDQVLTYIIIFISCIAAGLAIPFLLFRPKSW